jgi:hypothetical protein
MAMDNDLIAQRAPAFFFTLFGLYALYVWRDRRDQVGGYPYRVMGKDIHPRTGEWTALVGGVLFIVMAVLTLAGIIRFGDNVR